MASFYLSQGFPVIPNIIHTTTYYLWRTHTDLVACAADVIRLTIGGVAGYVHVFMTGGKFKSVENEPGIMYTLGKYICVGIHQTSRTKMWNNLLRNC